MNATASRALEVFKGCLRCQKPTLHRFEAELKGIALYRCAAGCGSAPRAVSSDLEQPAPAPRPPKPPIAAPAPAAPIAAKPKAAAPSAPAPSPRRATPMPSTTTPPPVRAGLIRLIDERIAAAAPSKAAPGLTASDVVAIIRKELGLEAAAARPAKPAKPSSSGRTCPSGKHNNPDSAWCRKACK